MISGLVFQKNQINISDQKSIKKFMNKKELNSSLSMFDALIWSDGINHFVYMEKNKFKVICGKFSMFGVLYRSYVENILTSGHMWKASV